MGSLSLMTRSVDCEHLTEVLRSHVIVDVYFDSQGFHPPPDLLKMSRHSWIGPQAAAPFQQQQQQPGPSHGALADSTSTHNNNNRQPAGAPSSAHPIAGSGSAMQWTGRKAPGWLRFNGKVLRFYAYFTEPVEQSAIERMRVRRCQIRQEGFRNQDKRNQ